MERKLAIVAVLLIVSSISAVVFGKRAISGKQAVKKYSALPRTQEASLFPQPQASIPEHVAYSFLFNRLIMVKQKVTKSTNPTATGLIVRTSIEQEAGLEDAQIRALDSIAFSCMQQVREQDERAGRVIAAFRARYPQRRIPPGESLPPPPAELRFMQVERNAIILRAQSQLREAIGEQAFNRLNDVVRRRIVGNIQSQQPNASQSKPRF
jgi:hypothetical protein